MFNISEAQMIMALEANGWHRGWVDRDWMKVGWPDTGYCSLKEAFIILLKDKNIL